MKARLLDMGTLKPVRSQSVFHAVTSVMEPDSDPVISLIRPSGTYVSVGYFQETEKEVDLEFCGHNHIPVFRRQVGGGAVLLDGGQLFFHVCVPVARAREFGLPDRLQDRFAYLAAPAIAAYRALGVEAAFRPINDIQVRGKKIGGTGVGEINNGLVFAGSMMLDFDTRLMARVLKVPNEKMRDKITETLDGYMTTLTRELGAPPEMKSVAEALISAFESHFGLELVPSALTPLEMEAMEEWDATLQSPDWLHLHRLKENPVREVKISARVRLLEAAHKAQGGLIRASMRVVDDTIEDLLLTGDFPVSPLSGLDTLARHFLGAQLDPRELSRRMDAALADPSFELVGVARQDFVELFGRMAPNPG
ncbi:MAG: lipoate--protein ligase family protein [Deltaproteobacteria bacterium]|nr:lipoate--protein ligase family protein [Deltaproteobacteria bacterium]